jgi:hypothetical protein
MNTIDNLKGKLRNPTAAAAVPALLFNGAGTAEADSLNVTKSDRFGVAVEADDN